jgi:hypothetical protein
MAEWFARSVFHVSNVEASLRFCVDRLGLTVSWRTGAGAHGQADAAQVDRQGCAIILKILNLRFQSKGVLGTALQSG